MIASRFLQHAFRRRFPSHNSQTTRYLSFNFIGPKILDEILKKELVEDKSREEVASLWSSFHEGKKNVHGLVLKGEESKQLLSRAASR
jgi:hypothetical protein